MAGIDALGAVVEKAQAASTIASPSPSSGTIVSAPVAPKQETVIDKARSAYPILNKYDIQYKQSIGRGTGYLESWPPGEGGVPELPRPKEFDMGKFGVEVYDPKTRPIDVLGDVVSHRLKDIDPVVSKTYQTFEKSITPKQELVLQDQYEYAKKNEGEKRGFKEWRDISGLPGMFRGYAFQQWPEDFNRRVYTPEQIKMFDGMMDYLKSK